MHSFQKASMRITININKWHHSMNMPSGRIKSESPNNNCTEHALKDTTVENTIQDDKGSSGGDTNKKKGEPVKGITLNAEGLGKGGQDGIAFTEISQEKGEEVGYLRIIASLDCTDVFILNSTIQQCFSYSYQQASAEEMLVKGKHAVEVRVAHRWY